MNGVVFTLNKLAQYLRQQGHDILFVVPRLPMGNVSADVVSLKSIPFPFYTEMRVVLPHWRFHKPEFEKIAGFNPELVHVWTPGVLGFFGQTWARRHGKPVVVSYETDILRYLSYYGFDRFRPQALKYFVWLCNNCRKTYVPSADTKRFLEANGISDVVVFERGVDSLRFHPGKRSEEVRKAFQLSPHDVMVLYVGRISKEKSLERLLDSFLRVSRTHISTRLVLAGDGPLRDRLQRKYGSDKIIFTGVKLGDDLSVLFASADIFALPSRSETLSLVSLEAMASGLPVIAMREGGVQDVVQSEQTGLLADSDTEFEMFLLRLLENPLYRSALAKEGRRQAESRTWERGFSILERDYRELVSSPKE